MSVSHGSLHIGVDASRSFAPEATGTENYARHVVEELLAIASQHDFTLYLRDSSGRLTGPRVEQRLIRPARLWTHVGLSLEMLRHPPDVLFVPAHVLPLVRPRRTVVTVHDLGYLFYPRTHPRSRWWYLHLSTAFHTRVATRLIADSETTKRDLVLRYGANPAKIAVVHLGVDRDFQPAGEDARLASKERYAGGLDYLLYVGTLQPRKNVGGLLAAYGVLRRRLSRPPALVIAGRHGWRASQILGEARARGLLDGVNLVEYVPRPELPALYAGALGLAFPSYYEGFGLPALEAMASGIPVVAAGNSALAEVVGDAGLLVDPHDVEVLAGALEQVACDEALRNDLGDRGRCRAATFTWQRCARETVAEIEQAAARQR